MDVFDLLNETMERLDRQLGSWPGWSTMNVRTVSASDNYSLHDVGDQYSLTLDAPGFRKDEFDIQAVEHTLHIRAELNPDNYKTAADVKKISGGRIKRKLQVTFTLPEDADMANMEARYDSGCLIVTIGKTKDSKTQGKKIEVK